MLVYETLPDQELTALLQQGDQNAFTEIYHRYKGLLYVHAYRRLHNNEEVHDIIHELFTTLWNKRNTINFTGQLSGYLYTSTRNRIIDFLSKQHYQSDYISAFQNFIDQSEAVTDHLVRKKQLAELIEREIALLPHKMQQVFRLSRSQNLSHKEIAEKLKLSELTVKKHVNNALKILRVRLGVLAYFVMISHL